MSTTMKLSENFVKPIAAGLLTYLGSMALNNSHNVKVFSVDVNNHMFYGALSTGGSFVSETVHEWVLPYIPKNKKLAQTESMLLAPVVNGLVLVGGKYYVGKNQPSIFDTQINAEDNKKMFLLGAASEVGAQYAFEAFLEPWLNENKDN